MMEDRSPDRAECEVDETGGSGCRSRLLEFGVGLTLSTCLWVVSWAIWLPGASRLALVEPTDGAAAESDTYVWDFGFLDWATYTCSYPPDSGGEEGAIPRRIQRRWDVHGFRLAATSCVGAIVFAVFLLALRRMSRSWGIALALVVFGAVAAWHVRELAVYLSTARKDEIYLFIWPWWHEPPRFYFGQ